jgi:ribosomal protein S18 acetylase RimI-like enzyme
VQGWRHYVGTLVEHRACGTVLPSTTRLAVAGGTLVGAALVTDLGPVTAHIAQVAVCPEWRRRGLAAHLIDETARRARVSGYARMTLLASASNAAAQSLYRGRGYLPRGTFLAATMRLAARRAARAS